jgi:type IV pilus assembly protein PilV
VRPGALAGDISGRLPLMRSMNMDFTMRPTTRTKRAARLHIRQHGVGLIEVLISLLIFSFGILGLVGLQARATLFSTNAEDTNRAALLANEAGTAMWNNNSVTLPAATVTAWQARVATAASAGLPGASGVISVAGNVAQISITWRPPQAASGASDYRYVTQVVVK